MSDATVDPEAIDAVAQLLSRRVGLRLDHAIRARLVSSIRDEAERLRLTPAAYAASLTADPHALQDLLNRVTVQETSFFRDGGQFAALAADVLPALAERGEPVRVWSAGCANGQEAYSLAMTLDESAIGTWEVIATDISTEALARTRAGRYSEREVAGLSEQRRRRHLVPATDPGAAGRSATPWEVAEGLRARVQVVAHNLVAEPPPFVPGACQIVFCRNVLIYFDRDNTVALLERLKRWLPPDGYLFLGYSESLWDLPNHFDLVRLGDAFVYRNPPAGTSPDASARPTQATATASTPIPRSRPPASSSPRSPRPSPSPAVAPSTSSPAPAAPGPADVPASSHDLFVQGEAALADGDAVAAIACFRQAVFLEPDNPLAYMHLGVALDAHGDDSAARRAFAAGRAALDRCDRASVEEVLEGYHFDELARVLERRARPT
jgi:chemotaxis protein methyltransferase CheR